MKPLFPYYGGKSRIADWLTSLMPEHSVYVEPFGGSAAVLLAKPPAAHEVFNDLDGAVVNFFRVLRDQPDELERACRLTPYARAEHASAELDDPTLSPVERARRWWVRSAQSVNGDMHGGWRTSVTRQPSVAASVARRIDRFDEVADRLSTVLFECLPAVEVINRYDRRGALIYVDPPYVHGTRSASGRYRHEMTDDQHEELAAVLAVCSATVIVSGYRSGLYDRLYDGWHVLSRDQVRWSAGGNGTATEVLWSNRPLDSGSLYALLAAGEVGQ